MDRGFLRQAFSPLRLFAVAAATVMIFLLASRLGWPQLLTRAGAPNPFWLALAGLAYMAKIALRATRLGALLQPARPNWARMAMATQMVTLLGNLLPFRVGELSFVFLMRQQFGMEAGKATGGLFFVRLHDFLSVAMVYAGLALVFGAPQGGVPWGYVAAVMAVLLLALLLVSKYLAALANVFLGWLPVLQKLPGAQTFARGLNDFTASQARLSLAIGFAEWLVNFVFGYWLLRAFGFGYGFLTAATAQAFSIFASVIPITTVGNFGSQDGGWIYGASLAGVDLAEATLSGLLVHAAMLFFILSFGLVALLAYAVVGKPAPAQPPAP